MPLERSLDEDSFEGFESSPLYIRLRRDINNGEVFPAIRKRKIDFYYKGGNLFSYDTTFTTLRKYAGVAIAKGDNLKEEDLGGKARLIKDFVEGYEQIKENCSKFAQEEDAAISKIYSGFSLAKRDSLVVALDIEIVFQESRDDVKDQIDLLLYNKEERTLRFYEAKRYGNHQLRGRDLPQVVAQVRRYEERILAQSENIVRQYANYVRLANRLWDCGLQEPKSLDNRVCLFIFDFDEDQEHGALRQILNNLQGICYYKIGHVENLDIRNMWNTVRCG
jgi:hypothetical protein